MFLNLTNCIPMQNPTDSPSEEDKLHQKPNQTNYRSCAGNAQAKVSL